MTNNNKINEIIVIKLSINAFIIDETHFRVKRCLQMTKAIVTYKITYDFYIPRYTRRSATVYSKISFATERVDARLNLQILEILTHIG